ncbi:tripartite tricarboxylate transporter substrate binding protein [Pigmentiphaga sp. H8]|uniref:Bug family tripartite tricarboxylate transporter substrate binding protein n=1 Tax=Pigmentiphaga sp. H8 TaxID=2488560 RepID=UPI001375C69A|nr:tripartite tricarboxylate transporter substrate binding protein [Pigmentiphaga sp. H8]
MEMRLAGMALCLACLVPSTVTAYPDKAVKVIVPYPPGGSVDATARAVSRALSVAWKKPVIVENHAGAGGNIGAELVSRAEPDGHTLLFAAPGPLAINKSLYEALPFDPEKLTPVSIVTQSTTVLLLRPGLDIGSVGQLIERARARPEAFTYASSGVGSTSHLAGELFKSMAGIQLLHVPYKGSAPALADVQAGHVDMVFVELSTALNPVREKQVRALAIGSAQREAVLPDVPTMAETLPGYLSTTWFGLTAPPGTSPAIAAHIADAVAQALRQPDVAQRLAGLNVRTIGNQPAEAAAFIKNERERWSRVLRAAGIRVRE